MLPARPLCAGLLCVGADEGQGAKRGGGAARVWHGPAGGPRARGRAAGAQQQVVRHDGAPAHTTAQGVPGALLSLGVPGAQLSWRSRRATRLEVQVRALHWLASPFRPLRSASCKLRLSVPEVMQPCCFTRACACLCSRSSCCVLPVGKRASRTCGRTGTRTCVRRVRVCGCAGALLGSPHAREPPQHAADAARRRRHRQRRRAAAAAAAPRCAHVLQALHPPFVQWWHPLQSCKRWWRVRLRRRAGRRRRCRRHGQGLAGGGAGPAGFGRDARAHAASPRRGAQRLAAAGGGRRAHQRQPGAGAPPHPCSPTHHHAEHRAAPLARSWRRTVQQRHSRLQRRRAMS